MAIARDVRMPAMACVDALSNGIANGMRAFAFASASILAMLTDIAPFFDEMCTFRSWHWSPALGSPFFDIRSICWYFANPILSHLGGLGINSECRSSIWLEFGRATFSRKRLECSAQGRHSGLGKAEIQRQLCQKLRFR
jgi:hypothetical protein